MPHVEPVHPRGGQHQSWLKVYEHSPHRDLGVTAGKDFCWKTRQL